MARTEQTRAPPFDAPRVQHFLDHAGGEAIRARIAQPGAFGDIASEDFSKNPVFAVQVYTLVDLHLDELSTTKWRIKTLDGSPQTELHSLVSSLGPMNSERAPPVFDIYPDPQPDALACIAHQEREIAHRKARADKPDTLLIPRFAHDWAGRRRTGFCIIITSDMRNIKIGHARDPETVAPVLWARFGRGMSSYNRDEISFNRLLDYYSQYGERSSEFQLLYYASFSRRSIDCDLEFDPDEVIEPLENYCDLGLDDSEKVAAESTELTAPTETLENLAHGLSLETFSLNATGKDAVVVSNNKLGVEPDLRYLIYVPFLLAIDVSTPLKQAAKTFTASITSRIADGKTVSFEFKKPSNSSHSSILADFYSRTKAEPEDYIGALLDLKEDDHSPEFKGRLHSQSHQSLGRRSNVFDENDGNPRYDGHVRYSTFVVILRDPNILVKGSVEYLLADGVAGEHVKRSSSHKMYREMILWRNDGIDETARRLEMRFED